MTIWGSLGSDGSLLVPVTLKEPGARPDNASAAVTVATCTSLPFGGQSVQPGAGMPEITGGVLSILIVIDTEFDRPTPFVAEQVMVTPAVSAVNGGPKTPFDEVISGSGSNTDQNTVTLLRYHPFMPSVPETLGMITGGVVSAMIRVAASATVLAFSTFPTRSRAML